MIQDLSNIRKLFAAEKLVVINVGVSAFAEAVAKQPNTDVVQVDWQPIAGGDKEMQDLLKLLGM